MTHRFPVKEIARQSGLGTATVDRVLNNRVHVSPQSRARVEAALRELEAQETLLAARGRRMFFDFLVEAPARFSAEVMRAAETVMPQIGSAVCRSRFCVQEIMSDDEAVAMLARIQKRGSDGVCVKLRDTPVIRRAVELLCGAGIPVVTLVTDIEETARIAYVGLDNEGAGETAAYLISRSVNAGAGTVLTTRSADGFLGEEAREASFVSALEQLRPDLQIVSLSGGRGRGRETAQLVSDLADRLTGLRAVYSMGGGNRAIIAALRDMALQPGVFVAHDLDRENRGLIADGEISFALHHDLRANLRSVFQAFLHHYKLVGEIREAPVSDVLVVTPFNVPADERA